MFREPVIASQDPSTNFACASAESAIGTEVNAIFLFENAFTNIPSVSLPIPTQIFAPSRPVKLPPAEDSEYESPLTSITISEWFDDSPWVVETPSEVPAAMII
jgi:hypothetical protein